MVYRNQSEYTRDQINALVLADELKNVVCSLRREGANNQIFPFLKKIEKFLILNKFQSKELIHIDAEVLGLCREIYGIQKYLFFTTKVDVLLFKIRMNRNHPLSLGYKFSRNKKKP